ncbi:MAG: DUF2252 family protein [Kofleriaceae bacterium]|nr:DUF2252 family protein [Kofleriaceae bacterium]
MRPSLVPALAVLVACADPADDRAAFLIGQLSEDNWVWSQREPGQVADKLRKMQRTAFDWMRGTTSVYWRDLTAPGAPWPTTTDLGDAAAAGVLLVGDPHPENLGTFRASDGTIYVDWNDFDAAGYGPYWGDLWRLATAVVIAVGQPDEASRRALADRVARAYADEIRGLATGTPATEITAAHPVLAELIDDAREDGDELDKLDEYAPVRDDGRRELLLGDLEAPGPDGVPEDRLDPVGVEAARWVAEAVARWRGSAQAPVSAAAATIKDMRRRVGAGVASYPALRYYALLEGETTSLDDDLLLELKETRDGLRLDVPGYQAAPWRSPGHRVVAAQRTIHARADGDPLLGWADLGALSFRVRDRTGYQRGLDAADLAELAATGDAAALLDLADVTGRLLARAHARTTTRGGVSAIEVIEPLLFEREDTLAAEVTAFALAYAAQIEADHAAMSLLDLPALVLGGGR